MHLKPLKPKYCQLIAQFLLVAAADCGERVAQHKHLRTFGNFH